MFRKMLALCAMMFIAACGNALPTEPVRAEMSAQSATSEWADWSINWFSLCGPTQFVEGTYRIHFTRKFVVNPDGSTSYRERFNVAGGRLFDTQDREYVFQNIGGGWQETTSTSGEAQYTYSFRIIPKGGGGTMEVLILTLNLRWDETGFYVTSSSATTCR